MSEETPPTPPRKTDEKGLTLSGRTILRIFHEFNRARSASKRVGEDDGFELIMHPNILVEIKALLWIAHEMSKRIGEDKDVQAYLREHEDADVKTVEDGIAEEASSMINRLGAALFGACEHCKKMKCPACRKCHKCEGGPTVERDPSQAN